MAEGVSGFENKPNPQESEEALGGERAKLKEAIKKLLEL